MKEKYSNKTMSYRASVSSNHILTFTTAVSRSIVWWCLTLPSIHTKTSRH